MNEQLVIGSTVVGSSSLVIFFLKYHFQRQNTLLENLANKINSLSQKIVALEEFRKNSEHQIHKIEALEKSQIITETNLKTAFEVIKELKQRG